MLHAGSPDRRAGWPGEGPARGVRGGGPTPWGAVRKGWGRGAPLILAVARPPAGRVPGRLTRCEQTRVPVGELVDTTALPCGCWHHVGVLPEGEVGVPRTRWRQGGPPVSTAPARPAACRRGGPRWALRSACTSGRRTCGARPASGWSVTVPQDPPDAAVGAHAATPDPRVPRVRHLVGQVQGHVGQFACPALEIEQEVGVGPGAAIRRSYAVSTAASAAPRSCRAVRGR